MSCQSCYPSATNTNSIEIVPILPDTLTSRAGVPEQNGKHCFLCRQPFGAWTSDEFVLTTLLVQRWVSVLLAAYGGALMLGARKSLVLPYRLVFVL